MKTGRKYSVQKMIESFKKSNVVLPEMNKYKLIYHDAILCEIDKSIGTNLGKKYLGLSEINKSFSIQKRMW